MARSRPRPFTSIRQLLLALLAIALVLRIGGTCEAMAATLAPLVEHTACAEMPMDHQKPAKPAAVDCALCIALPGTEAAPAASIPLVAMEPCSGFANRLAGLSGGPAPPPPRIV